MCTLVALCTRAGSARPGAGARRAFGGGVEAFGHNGEVKLVAYDAREARRAVVLSLHALVELEHLSLVSRQALRLPGVHEPHGAFRVRCQRLPAASERQEQS